MTNAAYAMLAVGGVVMMIAGTRLDMDQSPFGWVVFLGGAAVLFFSQYLK